MLHVAILALALTADQPKDQAAQQKIVNPGYFDIAVCAPSKPSMPEVVNKEVLLGVIQSARPLVLECLTDAKSRTAEGQVIVGVDSTLTETGATNAVSGQGLSPAGTACVQKAIDDWTKGFPQLGQGHTASKEPVKAHFDVSYVPGVQPSAKLGINEASDIFATIRLAQPSWCECYAPAAAGAVPELRGTMKLKKAEKAAETSPSDVALSAQNDPAGEKIAACVKGKVAALKVKNPTEPELDLPLVVQLLNSNFGGKLPGAPAPLQFAQYDLNGNQLIAQMLIHDGGRAAAEERYSQMAVDYNSRKKKLSLTQVTEACQAVMKADEPLLADNQKLLAQAKEVHDFAAEQKAKDANWAAAEAATAKRVPAIEAQAAKVQKLVDSDKARCEKLAAEEKQVETKKPAGKKGKK